MAICDKCGNFDDANLTDVAYKNPLDIKDYQPDLYYYLDSPIEKDYSWQDALPDANCLCEICFNILNQEKKIEWV